MHVKTVNTGEKNAGPYSGSTRQAHFDLHCLPVLGCGSFVKGRKRKKGDPIPFILSRRDYM